MTVIYLTEYNTRCYARIFQNNGSVTVQNFEDISNSENIINCITPLEIFLGKSHICNMKILLGALDKSLLDGNSILIKISEENNKNKYVYIGGDMICSFLTNDNNYKYFSNMGNNLTPYSIAIGEEKIYFLTPYFKFI